MFATGFQSYAFQVAGAGTATAVPGGYVYIPHHQAKIEERQRETIRREKSDLERLESVLAENRRKAELAAESKKAADKRNTARLENLEKELLQEIARLLVARAELIRRIKQSEDMLIIMMAMKRKRFRAANWQAQNMLAIL